MEQGISSEPSPSMRKGWIGVPLAKLKQPSPLSSPVEGEEVKCAVDFLAGVGRPDRFERFTIQAAGCVGGT